LIFDCEFFQLYSLANGSGSIGLFYVDPPDLDTGGECIEINEADFKAKGLDDAAWKCARVCACLALCFGCILFVFAFMKQCIIPLPCSQRIIDLSSTLVQVFLALVYVMWMSDACDRYSCDYGQGGTYLILTQVFWLAAGCFTRCMRPGRFERRDEIAANKAQKAEEKKRKDAEDQLAQKEAELEAKEKELVARDGGGDDEEQPATN
jgi:hypothetical protein